MKTTIRVFGTNGVTEQEHQRPMLVKHLLLLANIELPMDRGRPFEIAVNEQMARMDSAVSPGDRVTLLPPVWTSYSPLHDLSLVEHYRAIILALDDGQSAPLMDAIIAGKVADFLLPYQERLPK